MMSVLNIQKIARLVSLLLVVFCFAAEARSEEAIKVSLCQLKKDPEAYDHKLVQVTAFVSHGFEYFSPFEPGCSSENGIWLEYGGTVRSGTIYCCGVPSRGKRPKQLVVEKIRIPLIDDRVFREFNRQVHRFENSYTHATIVGRFFSDAKMKGGNSFGGYGHLGCCSLLAIQQVLSVDPHDRHDLYYGGPTDQPNLGAGCHYGWLQDLSYDEVEAQHLAELGQREWSFDDPQRVAVETLARILKIDEKSIIGIKQTSASQGRAVYDWTPQTKLVTYMIVVRRPFWLAYYATGTKRVVWIVTGVYESSCK